MSPKNVGWILRPRPSGLVLNRARATCLYLLRGHGGTDNPYGCVIRCSRKQRVTSAAAPRLFLTLSYAMAIKHTEEHGIADQNYMEMVIIII